jgi:hypothetical protein
MNRLQYLMIFDLSSLSVDVNVNAVYRPAYVCNSSELAGSSIDVSYQLGTINSIYTYKCCCCCGDRRAPPNANQMEVSGTVELNPHVESKGRDWVVVIGKEKDDSWANRVEVRKHERRQLCELRIGCLGFIMSRTEWVAVMRRLPSGAAEDPKLLSSC